MGNISLKRNRRLNILIVMVIFAGMTFYCLFMGRSQEIMLKFESARLQIVYPDTSIELPYSSIRNISYMEFPEFGSCIKGGKEKTYQYGIWENELWGRYYMCVYSTSPTCIVIDAGEDIYVISGDSEITTSEIYNKFVEILRE